MKQCAFLAQWLLRAKDGLIKFAAISVFLLIGLNVIKEIEFNYDLLLEDRSISLWSYNLETILAEKLQTVLARGILNTRMRDFYDIRMLLDTYEDKVNKAVLKDAFAATCKKRGTDHLQEQAEEIIKIIEADEQLRVLWRAYQKKYSYAAEIDYASVISGVRKLMDWIR